MAPPGWGAEYILVVDVVMGNFDCSGNEIAVWEICFLFFLFEWNGVDVFYQNRLGFLAWILRLIIYKKKINSCVIIMELLIVLESQVFFVLNVYKTAWPTENPYHKHSNYFSSAELISIIGDIEH